MERNKGGRAPVMVNGITTSFVMPETLKFEIDRISKSQGRSRSDFAREVFERAVREEA
ncbi:putative DNA-binding protein [Bradyrhizobium elkanii]|uniref:ribbon-helix-helix domain-containing protein n=1 Tax=Bradyrhizobium TaxID=374 RepID=UPI002168BD19|nr:MULTISPECIES: ribbon-helix-helix domain-containing protein [Bradyrhizobium]MCS3929550.1 putative DNA-binding protein [Bradyrhizobium elkanii]MCS3970106.1 putative DNA-binding protein [Bradyrhizobium japonicum]